MADGDGGCIINVSSTGSVMAAPSIVPYGAAKAALNAMSVSLAKEYAPKVRVNTLMPGPLSDGHRQRMDTRKAREIAQCTTPTRQAQ
jgi:NAD(P)-dependent dehydrogenase (short-subunit alcohol dehydrogenase family)